MKSTPETIFNKSYDKLIKCLKLRGFRKSTIDGYSRAVWKIAEHFDFNIDNLSGDQLLDYFSALIEYRTWSTVKVAYNGVRFYYEHVLEKTWEHIDMVKPPTVQTLPEIISQEEVSPLLNTIVKPSYRVFFVCLQHGASLRRNINITPQRYSSQESTSLYTLLQRWQKPNGATTTRYLTRASSTLGHTSQ